MPSASTSSWPPETSRFSRSKSSSTSVGIETSTCSMAFCTAFCSLSSSTTTASMDSPVWNLISSMPCRLVGSATATCRRLPRLTSGRMRCLASSLSLTIRTASRSTVTASRSSSGTPNSCAAAMAMSRADARSWLTSQVTTWTFFSRAVATARTMASSSRMPSCTRRCGRPPSVSLAVEAAAMAAESFMMLAGPGRRRRATR